MEKYDDFLGELMEENVRYLPLYYLNEVLELLFSSLDSMPKEMAVEILYRLRINPKVRDRVNELLFLIQ